MSFFIDALRKLPDGKTTARRVGEYWTHDEAVAAAKHLIDTFLYHEILKTASHGVTPESLLARYNAAGEQPMILRDSESSTNVSRFDPAKYATQRCQEICGGAKKN
jgi:hypothetical protein